MNQTAKTPGDPFIWDEDTTAPTNRPIVVPAPHPILPGPEQTTTDGTGVYPLEINPNDIIATPHDVIPWDNISIPAPKCFGCKEELKGDEEGLCEDCRRALIAARVFLAGDPDKDKDKDGENS